MRVKEAVGDGTKVGIHCHNQLALALPNTLAAIKAGAAQVESCLLGIGDAGGNLATEQLLAHCEHFGSTNPPFEEEDDEYDLFPLCSAPGTSLPSAVSLAGEVARLMSFLVGENQPIIGERSYDCTTGIHQDQLSHLSHTSFAPSKFGREWRVSLNRHSSKKAVVSMIEKYCKAKGGGSDEHLADAIYGYLSYQISQMDAEAIFSICDKLLEAYDILSEGGVLMVPTTVGYTLITANDGTKKMKLMKGRPESKPCGILGTRDVFRSIFCMEPPIKCSHSEKYVLGHIGKPAASSSYTDVPKDAIGPAGEVGVWLENGPIVDYLANRLWSESGDVSDEPFTCASVDGKPLTLLHSNALQQVIIATSCNMAGEGNPKSDKYNPEFVDSRLRSKVDHAIDIPHWEVPRLDEEGRWPSATIWEIGTGNFVRKGRDHEILSELVCTANAFV